MSRINRRGRAYRIIAILLAFLLIGIAVFVPILAGKDVNYVVLWVALSIYAVALVGTIVANEIIIYKRNKNLPDQSDGE